MLTEEAEAPRLKVSHPKHLCQQQSSIFRSWASRFSAPGCQTPPHCFPGPVHTCQVAAWIGTYASAICAGDGGTGARHGEEHQEGGNGDPATHRTPQEDPGGSRWHLKRWCSSRVPPEGAVAQARPCEQKPRRAPGVQRARSQWGPQNERGSRAARAGDTASGGPCSKHPWPPKADLTEGPLVITTLFPH